jgi:hypothetical protein
MNSRRHDDDVRAARAWLGAFLLGMFVMALIFMAWQGKP